MKKSLSTLMDEVRVRLKSLESDLPTHVDAMDVSPISKLPFKVLLYRNALMWRFAELGRGAFDDLCEDKLVSGIVLTRATVETSGALWFLCAKVEEAVKSQSVGDIDEHLMKLVVGIATDAPKTKSKGDATFPRPVKVGAFLKLVEKDVEGFSNQYGILSEYAHPNWAGTVLLFSKNDTKNRTTDFGRNIRKGESTKGIGIGNLSAALAMFERSYKRILDLLPAFTALCESRLKNTEDVSVRDIDRK
jgi:hypothetical protein